MTLPGGPFEQAATFRDESDAISASWWNGPTGKKVRYCMAILWDGIADGALYAAEVGSPSIAPYDAMQWAGKDRQTIWGYQESQASYVSRSIQWLDRWPYSGKAIGVMLGTIGWLLPQIPRIRVVTNNSRWWTYASGVNPMPPGTTAPVPPTLVKGNYTGGGGGPPGHWNWDGLLTVWARSWLIIYATGVPWVVPEANTWGTGTWGDGLAWGFENTPSIFSGLSSVVRLLKGAYAWYPWVIVSFDDTLFDPARHDDGTHNPNGIFGNWSQVVGGQYVPSRFASARYVDGVQ